ncbi:ABC transporter ATP-binding protein [Pseudomonas typographi]|uniref:ABC transporter ATP-binding protein n=1 Tax=Pseudomonas typographi TaxID=2715964 RepID=A0ABR7YZU1_9PSED|nr:ABC transporter ATP-binding protein [Pseudomonas typographi]MBD1586800.1 ABC transporter ATP-binding protein [Pseudomonas typographi]MBD1598694.1 ABC transporter ATP-binding protein [Pseudomonas typographi]
MSALLTLRGLACSYAGQPVVNGLSLALQPGEIGCLLGASGCGKTTTLRAIAGFETPTAGEITLAGECLAKPGYSLPAERRKVGMVFQDYALFPHLSVARNIAFGLRGHRSPSAVVSDWLERVNLQGLGERRPDELSGGQQQRVALARALAPEPRLLLLDEPFSNLDVELRRRLSLEVREVLKARGISALLVTHDQDEAFAVSDRVGVMRRGVLEQWATPHELYHCPATRYVATFVGQGYFLPGRVGQGELHTELGTFALPASMAHLPGETAQLLLRPEHLQAEPGGLPCTVRQRSFMGGHTAYRVITPQGTALEALVPSQVDAAVGTTLRLSRMAAPATVFHPAATATP